MMKKICLVGACALLGTLAAEAKIVFNGMCVGKHQGAFTAFGAELTPYVVNHDNVLEITVDNFWDADIPPLCADYTVCGGLYRPVWLIETDRVCIDPVADGADGIRTTHYPHSRAFFEKADRAGFLVWTELPPTDGWWELVLTEKRKPERRDRAAAPPDRSSGRIRGFTRRAVNSLQSHPDRGGL